MASTDSTVRSLACFLVLAGQAAGQPDTPKPKSDAEQLEGAWERPVGEGKAVFQIVFRDKTGGQIQFVRLTEKPNVFEFGGGAGFKYKLDTCGKKKVVLLDNCLWFDGKKAEVEYEFVDGQLRLGEAKLNEDVSGHSLKGDWSRLKK